MNPRRSGINVLLRYSITMTPGKCNHTENAESGHRAKQTGHLINTGYNSGFHSYEQQPGVVWLVGWLTRMAPSAETPVVGLTASA